MMKKLILSLVLFAATTAYTSAQVIPSFQFGLKAGANLSKFSTKNTFSSDNRAGYLAGVWARVGALGLHFQPELYLTGKNTELKDNNGNVNKVNFTSLDLPLLVGTKFGAAGIGGRLNTGPVVSFVLNKDQSFGQAVGDIANLRFKSQAFAWQFGAGLDVSKISFDLRYELGLTNMNKDGQSTKLNMFNLSVGYRLF